MLFGVAFCHFENHISILAHMTHLCIHEDWFVIEKGDHFVDMPRIKQLPDLKPQHTDMHQTSIAIPKKQGQSQNVVFASVSHFLSNPPSTAMWVAAENSAKQHFCLLMVVCRGPKTVVLSLFSPLCHAEFADFKWKSSPAFWIEPVLSRYETHQSILIPIPSSESWCESVSHWLMCPCRPMVANDCGLWVELSSS